ncbi:MAG: PAS domain-containing protein, partial [Arenimonas sp.]
LRDAAEGRAVSAFESVRRHKDGRRIDVSIAAVPLFDDRGQLAELSKTIRDITSLKHAEQELRALNATLEQQVADRTAALTWERERLDYIIAGTNVGTWEWNVQTGELHINEQWAGIIGYTPEELQPLSILIWDKVVHPEDGAHSADLLERHFRGETAFYEAQVRMRHKDGHWVWVLDRGKVSTRMADGRPEWMHGTHMDISEQHNLLERVRANEILLETIGGMAGTGGWQWDLQTNRLFWTQGCKHVHEVAPDYQPVLETAFEFYPPEARVLLREAAEAAITQGRNYDMELPFVTAKGRPLWVRVIGRAETENGKVFRLIGAIQDVTLRRDAENELVQAMQMAEAASAAKSAFLANTSHEIRTPLNAMIGLSHLLEQTRLDTEQQSLLGKIQLASRALLGVVNDVLDLSKIEAGEMSIDSTPFDLCDLLREVADLWRPQADSKRLSLRTELPAERHCIVLGDGMRLRQMLNNLLGNAVKFTERGGITLSGEVLEESNDRVLVRLAVRDTGIGIAPDKLPQLFTPFTQADASTTRKYGGTGLGLSIVKHLANLMGGEAGAESRPGEGSVFWVRLPLQTVSQNASSADDQPKTLAVLIACADGDERNRLSAIARGLGWKAETASDAITALARLEAHPSGMPPIDAVLVEPWPESEESALRALHERLPTVLLTDRGRIEGRNAMPDNDGMLLAPAGSSALFNGVHSAIIRRGGDHDRLLQSTPIEATGALWLPGVNVLLVDDSEINLEVAQRILEREGAVVTCAGNGKAALDLLRGDPGAFDIVLMDVQMPVMDGHEAASRIRRELGLSHLPVLALTAGALLGERQRATDAGMNDFISKPIDPRGLIRRVRAHVERVRGAALPLVLRKPTATAGTGWPEIAGIDNAQAAARIGDDWPLFTRMLKRLLRDSVDFTVTPAPTVLVDEARQRELAARLHKLRGNAGLLGAMELHRLAGEAETHCREKRLSPLRATLENLASALQELGASADGILNTVEPAADTVPAPATDGATIAHIRSLLAANDLEALTLIKAEAAGLRSLIGHEGYASLQDAVEELDFGKAAGLLPEG